MKTLALILTAVLVMLGMAPAHADKPADATLTVAPAAPHVGDTLAFTGCGYEPGVGVTFVVSSPNAVSFFGDLPDTDGCIDTSATQTYTTFTAGDYTASAYQSSRHRADASVSFTVTP